MGELEHLRLHRRHVEDGRDEVVGERGVADPTVDDLDLLHECQPETLGSPAFDLALDGDRIDGLADVLRGRQLDDANQPELGVDVDDGAVCGVRERHVRVALSPLVIDGPGGAMVVLALLVHDIVAKDVGRARR